MKINEIMTFWGTRGAGCIFLAKNTGRIGISFRSRNVQQPGTWGTVGGAIDIHEDPKTATIRETEEELGYNMHNGDYLIKLDFFQQDTFNYTTFIYVVKIEFKAILNWENDDFKWLYLNELPSPLHFGLNSTLNKPQCIKIIDREYKKYANKRIIRK